MHDASARFRILTKIRYAMRNIPHWSSVHNNNTITLKSLFLLFFPGQSNEPQLRPAAFKAELRQLLEVFHIRMQRTYWALKIKHRRELLKLRDRGTIRALVEHIHRGKYTLEQEV